MHALASLCLAGALALAPASPASSPAPAQGKPSSNAWVTYFYRDARVDLFPEMVARLDAEGTFDKETARAPLGAFLSVVLRRPDVRAEALVESAAVGPTGREALVEALWLAGKGEAAARIALARKLPAERYRQPPPDLLTLPLDEPADLDRMWGAFLASGDVAYPRRLVDLLDLPEAARGDARRYGVLAGAARWSLGSNARQHPAILGLVREEARRRTGPAKEVLAAIVAENAEPTAPAAPPGGRMSRLVYRDVSPGLPRGSFARKPKTLYRVGDTFARVEEQPDPPRGIHGLIVVAEPQIWMVNLTDRTGQRIVDRSPPLIFRAPVIPPPQDGPPPPMIELGHEAEFLQAHGAVRREVTEGGRKLEALAARVDGYSITLLSAPDTKRPARLRVERKGSDPIEFEYLEYERDLPPRMELFAPPEGIRIREVE